jgi:hypothetical protein
MDDAKRVAHTHRPNNSKQRTFDVLQNPDILTGWRHPWLNLVAAVAFMIGMATGRLAAWGSDSDKEAPSGGGVVGGAGHCGAHSGAAEPSAYD